MCLYIICLLNDDSKIAALNHIASNFGLKFVKINQKICSQFGRFKITGTLTTSSCDCLTPLGYQSTRRFDNHSMENDTKKLKRKGWSKSRILRSLEQKKNDLAHKEELQETDRNEELGQWLVFLRKAVSESRIGAVGIILHNFEGKIGEEEINPKSIEELSISKCDVTFLSNIICDVIYDFRI